MNGKNLPARGLVWPALVFLTALSVKAGVVPGRWEKLETAAKPGMVLTLELESGDRLPMRFLRVEPNALFFDNGLGGELAIERNRFVRISLDRCRGENLGEAGVFSTFLAVLVGAVVGRKVSRAAGIASGAALGGLFTFGLIRCTREEVLYLARSARAGPRSP